jgi:plastocyanin
MTRYRAIATALAAALLLALAGAAGAAQLSAAAKHRVTIKGDYMSGYRFAPHKLTIKKGQSVTWSWSSDAEHNVHFGKKLHHRHSKTSADVGKFRVKFKKTGTFKYTCTVHGFSGKIVVTK